MALPSSQPVASLVCGDSGRLSRGSGGRGGSGRARAGRPLRVVGASPQLPQVPPHPTPPAACPAHQVPGVAGALSGLGVPATPLEGQHHVPALVAIEHGVSGRDVDVEELGWAARLFHAHQVREHVVACGRRGANW